MDKNKWFKIGGIAAIVVGSVLLFASGSGEVVVTTLVGAVFVICGIIESILRK